MSTTYTEATVGQLVTERPARARVFEKHGIDFCCGGRKPLSAACAEKGLELAAVLGEIEAIDRQAPPDHTDWSKASMTELCDHIVNTHHEFLRHELPRLGMYLERLVEVHGPNHPELRQVRDIFAAMKEELYSHMMKEEQILFPICRQLDSAAGQQAFHCGSVQNPIRVMVMEHDHAGDALQRIRQLTGGYEAPADACNTYRATYDGLEQLELDLHQHIHKENNILFPRAVEAEAKLGA